MNLDFHKLVEVHFHVSYGASRKELLRNSRLPRQFQASFTMEDDQVHRLDLCYLQSGNNRDAWIIKGTPYLLKGMVFRKDHNECMNEWEVVDGACGILHTCSIFAH